MFAELIECVSDGENLSREQAASALEQILGGEVADPPIERFLVALAEKGETVEELVGFAAGMRRLAVPIRCSHETFVDTAGTGGGRSSFNISTAAAFVIAAAGVPVAKHGNRAITSRSGSADVLRELGVAIDRPAEVSARALEEVGICFLFAPHFHPAMKRVAELRRRLARRMIFNLLGPLTNPAGAPVQLIGAFAPEAVPLLAGALARLGTRRAWVVHGHDGLDELSAAGPSWVCETRGSSVRRFEFRPMERSGEVPGGQPPAESARLLRGILAGQERGAARAFVLVNAAAAIHLAREREFADSLERAEEALDSGRALAKLEELIRFYGT